MNEITEEKIKIMRNMTTILIVRSDLKQSDIHKF